MVAAKGKSNTFLNRVEDCGSSKSGGVKNFKVYADSDMAKVRPHDSCTAKYKETSRDSLMVPGPGRKSISVKKTIVQNNTGNLKGAPKRLDKSKAKCDSSIKINVARKALADVSNLRGNFSRTQDHDGYKPLKGKNERITSLQRVSTDSGTRGTSSSSSKCIVGKVRQSQRQIYAGYPTMKRALETKDLKVCTDDLESKGWGHEFSEDGQITTRNGLPPTRKSLPVSKCVKQVETGGKKITAGNLDKGQGISGFHVKPKVGSKVMCQVSNGRSNLWRNRVSDGFIMMASKRQPKLDTQAYSRKSVKPTVNTTNREVASGKVSRRSKCVSGMNKSTSGAAVSYRKKDELVTSLPETRESSASQEQPAQTSNQTTVSDSLPTRKSSRRKSFTSLLMARSKLLDAYTGATKQEKLPAIYDDRNHLEVTEYVDEIYQYYWLMEAQNQSLANYMAIQTEITPQMRGILINWLIEVHLKFDLMQETLYLTITLLDRYLSLVTIKRNEMQLVGLTALLLASKYEDFWHPRVLDLISISAESYTRDQMLGMERAILRTLKFRLNAPTPYVFMLRFLKAAGADTKLEHLAFYLIELCLVEYEALKFKPSLLCASAIYVASCTLHKSPAWTPLLGSHAHYEEHQIRDCAEMVLKFHRSAKTAILKVTYEKYATVDYSEVATIKPLNGLPALS
ncbi:hypothetical protein NMG60_11001938 [Bertholletia excelsa]